MADASRNHQDNGIPSGLNRIKTRGGLSKDQPSSKPDELTDSRSYGVSRPPQKQKQKQKTAAQGHVKLTNPSKEGLIFVFLFLPGQKIMIQST